MSEYVDKVKKYVPDCNEAAVAGIEQDDSGVERVFQSIYMAAEKYLNADKYENGLDSGDIFLYTGNLLAGITDTYDFIAANIFTHVILELLDDLPRALNKDGIFVCSGMFAENKKLVIARLKNMRFDILEIREQEEWAAIASRFTKRRKA